MKTIDTNTTGTTTTGTTTGTKNTGNKFGCIGGTSTCTPVTTGTATYGSPSKGTTKGTTPSSKKGASAPSVDGYCGGATVSVPRSYIMTHLCGDAATVTSVGTELFGNPGSQYVNISRGILFYAILKEGEYAINYALPSSKTCSPAEVAGIPMSFLTDCLRNSWTSYVTKKLVNGRSVTTSDTLTLWHDFVRTFIGGDVSSFGPGFSPTVTDPTCYNTTKGVMLYTLYREGKAVISSQFSGSGYIKMNFLPVELKDSWETTIKGTLSQTPTMGDVIGCWRTFILKNVSIESQTYATRFEMLMSPSRP